MKNELESSPTNADSPPPRKPIRAPVLGGVLANIGKFLPELSYILLRSAKELTPIRGPAFVFSLMFAAIGKTFGPILEAKTAAERLRDNPNPPIVYIRGFAGESAHISKRIFRNFLLPFSNESRQMLTGEEHLDSILGVYGPFIAIGRPDEELQTPGPGKEYLSNAEWKAAIEDWMRRSQLVVIRADFTPNLTWEITRAKELKTPRELLVYVPCPQSRLLEFLTRPARLAHYAKVRLGLSDLLSLPDPEQLGKSRFIWFDHDGSPLILEAQKRPFWRLRLSDLKDADVSDETFAFQSALKTLEEFLEQRLSEVSQLPNTEQQDSDYDPW
jgi:hypothetical protein